MYGKLFEQTFTGSMAGSGPCVFAVWSYVIAHARSGQVELNPVIISAVLGAPIEAVNDAIEYLCAADPRSRTKAHEGRRLLRVGEFVFDVPNHAHYHGLRNDAERREYNRLKQQESRSRKRQPKSSRPSLTVIDKSALSAHTDSYTDTDSEAERTIPPTPLSGAPSRKRKPARSCKAPETWTPAQSVLDVGAELGLTPADVALEFAKLRDYEFKTGHSDWDAVARNWLRTAAQRRWVGRAAPLSKSAALVDEADRNLAEYRRLKGEL